MPFLLAGLLLVWFASVGLKSFTRANPAALARLLRRGSALLAMAAAVLLLLRGRIDLAFLLAGLSFWLMTGRKPKTSASSDRYTSNNSVAIRTMLMMDNHDTCDLMVSRAFTEKMPGPVIVSLALGLTPAMASKAC